MAKPANDVLCITMLVKTHNIGEERSEDQKGLKNICKLFFFLMVGVSPTIKESI
jgi:hypothetical protein